MPYPSAPLLTLIDGSGFIFRAFYALPPMTRPDGVPVNAVYGFCTMLNKLLGESETLHIAVVFDAARKTFRNDIYPDYKAHRPPPPEALVPQFPLMREAAAAFGLPAVEEQNYEADDLIAAYAKEALAKGMRVRIVSSDKDLMQLIRDGVELYDPLKSTPIGLEEVMKKFGVAPDKVVDVQSLAGDSTDNVPGVPGIGVKTAAELITAFGSLEALLEKADTIKQPKRREVLIQNAELARISKKLVTLDENAPLPTPIEALSWEKDHHASLAAFFSEQGFKSLLAKLPATAQEATLMPHRHAAMDSRLRGNDGGGNGKDGGGNGKDGESKEQEEIAYETVQTEAQLRAWVAQAKAQGYIALDTETDSLNACTAKLAGISLALAPGKACYIPVGHIAWDAAEDGGFAFEGAPAIDQLSARKVAQMLQDLLVDPAVMKIAHNLKYDSQVLAQHGISVFPYDDTMLLSYALDAGLHGHGLDELALLYFGHKMISFAEVAGTGKKQITFDRVPLDKATAYSAEDADFTLRLWLLLKPRIAQENRTRVYERLDRPLVPVVAAMETTGVHIDPEILRRQGSNLALRMNKLEEEIQGIAGHSFNVGSPQQLGQVLFGDLGLPGGKRGKNGHYSTASDILEPLAEAGHEIVEKVLDWRSVSKLKSTYTDALPEQINPHTKRIHTSFNLVGAATGRLSSTDPNLQNIPIRTEDGRAIRQAFVAERGCVLLSVDYSQIELRLAASAANVGALIQAFKDGLDIHTLTASQAFGLPLDQVTPDRRRAAKAINFGIIYGLSGFGLSKQIGISPGEATAFIRHYLDRFHELRDWLEETKAFARTHGFVETLFGRKIHIQGIGDKNPARRNAAERQAINAPLQGTAADIMKRAMIRVGPALAEAGLGAKMLIQVHDELVFEVPKDEIEATVPLVKKVMEEAPAPCVSLNVPLVAEAGFAANWAEAH